MPHGVLSFNLPLEKYKHRLRAGINKSEPGGGYDRESLAVKTSSTVWSSVSSVKGFVK